MEKIYPKKPESCALISSRPGTIRFLMDYSRSLDIVKHGDITFENNLN